MAESDSPDSPDSPDEVYGDFIGPLQPPINKAIMDAFMRLPAILEQQIEGETGPAELPPEQYAEAMRNALTIMLQHLPNIAGALDIARSRITRLEKRIEELERGNAA